MADFTANTIYRIWYVRPESPPASIPSDEQAPQTLPEPAAPAPPPAPAPVPAGRLTALYRTGVALLLAGSFLGLLGVSVLVWVRRHSRSLPYGSRAGSASRRRTPR